MRLLVAAIALWVRAAAGAESAACAPCHRAIYDSYQHTPMAASSGEAGRATPAEAFGRAAFTHVASGFRYRVSRNRGNLWMEFEKTADPSLRGKKQLVWFVGSGAVARSYLLVADGFLFEAPVAYYSAGASWDLAPAYDRYAYPFLTRPIAPACLTCHASGLAVVPGTQNRFGPRPFRESGIACERCHGPGEAHIEKMKSGQGEGDSRILNPANLMADRRDSVCAQCHLSGEVRVNRPGGTWDTYRPGARLADSMTVFVRAQVSPGMTVNSHFEKLAQSACKQRAGDRLWCGSCHDPHSVPAAPERAAWFRRKCLNCHAEQPCKETPAVRARRQDDCTACHMPKSPVTDALHVVYTDHSIPRRPRPAASPPAGTDLVPFEGFTASLRDQALAYAIAAVRQPPAPGPTRALQLLKAAEQNSPDDSEVLLYLAEIYRTGGQPDRAIPLYRRAMRLDPTQVTASVGLGGILFERGQYSESIRLWQDALSRNSGLVLVSTNLAMAQWNSGDLASTESTLRRVIDLSPCFQPARDLLRRLLDALARR